MNITEVKRTLREELYFLECALSFHLEQVQKDPEKKKFFEDRIKDDELQINAVKFYLISTKITHLFIIFNKASIHRRCRYTPQFISSLENLKKELRLCDNF
jgi:hypothetical protein